MSFGALPKAVTAAWYEKRPLEKLPGDLLEACDQLRAQKKEMNEMRADLIEAKKGKFRLGVQNAVLMAILGGAAAKGIEVGVVALIAIFAK